MTVLNQKSLRALNLLQQIARLDSANNTSVRVSLLYSNTDLVVVIPRVHHFRDKLV